MNHLLHWSIEHKRGEPVGEVDPKWIDVILGKTSALHIQEQFESIVQADVSDQIQLLEGLEDYCADIDNANSFTDWKYLVKLLDFPELKPHVYHLLGTIMQNNLHAQKPFLNYLDWSILDDLSVDQHTQDKLMYCLSAMMPLNVEMVTSFKEAGGFQRVISHTNRQDRDHTKALYFLRKNSDSALSDVQQEAQ